MSLLFIMSEFSYSEENMTSCHFISLMLLGLGELDYYVQMNNNISIYIYICIVYNNIRQRSIHQSLFLMHSVF